MATIAGGDRLGNPANDLYENRDHFQAIFSNDSRFFDTSLHLFKSYVELGHIESTEKKNKKFSMASLTASGNGRKHRWRPRLLGFERHDHHNGTLKGFLTPTLLRKHGKCSLSDQYRLLSFLRDQITHRAFRQTQVFHPME
jgi:hypothetical protein